MIQNWVES